MKIINTMKSSIINLYASLKRFPISIGLSTLATILLIVLTHYDQSFSSDTRELIGRIIMILALGIPVSLCSKLIFERKENINLGVKTAAYLLEALVLVFYYFFLLKDFSMVSVTRYIGLSLAFYLAFSFIPYFFRRDGFELYVIKLLTRFFITVVYSIVLFLGIVAILFTIDKLLEIRVDEKVYFDVWLGVVGIFAPSFFLAGAPLYKEQFETSTYPKILKVLLLYIVMPILSVYTAILYIYFAKIIVTLQWPIGMVAHLVLWYSVICTAIIFLISPLNDENKWTRTFIFLLPKLIIPLIIMMFVSIGIRVKAYGITENRYFVILLGLWAFGIMIHSNFVKTRRNIILPISLSLIALLSVVGPWSSYSVSKLSQNLRFEDILLKYDMIRDNSIVKSDQDVSAIDKKEISQILNYFSQSHTLNDVKYLPKKFELSQMSNVFGFPNTEYNYDNRNREYFSYSSNILSNPIDIKGYSYMFPAKNYNSSGINSGYDIEIKYDDATHEVIIYSGNKEIYRNSLLDFGKQIHKKYGTDNKYNIDSNEMSFVDENENIKVKFIFNNINGYEDETGSSIDVSSMDFYILVNLK